VNVGVKRAGVGSQDLNLKAVIYGSEIFVIAIKTREAERDVLDP
jgi:hypothetical protein